MARDTGAHFPGADPELRRFSCLQPSCYLSRQKLMTSQKSGRFSSNATPQLSDSRERKLGPLLVYYNLLGYRTNERER